MESKHSANEAALIRKILGQGFKPYPTRGETVLVEDWEHCWDPPKSSVDERVHRFSYILNPTGTIRWFFPSDIPYPAYLGLYNSAHLKARVYKLFTHMAFAFNLQKKLYSGEFSIKTTELPFKHLLKVLDAQTYAVFTGTVGENRKSVVAIYRNKIISHFVKLAHSPTASNILKNEKEVLERLEKFPFLRLKHPRVHTESSENCLILSNIKPTPAREVARLEDMHIEVLGEIYKFTSSEVNIADADFYQEIHKNLSRICTREIKDPSLDTPKLKRLIDGLIQLSKSINAEKSIQCGLAHGDFTPWNMYLSDNYVHVYDWELAEEGRPILFDFFHFVYQSGVLLLRQNHEQIAREITRSLGLPHTGKICEKYNIDPHLYHKLYLLYIVSYYLRIYMDEPKVHMQVHWLINIWDKALQEVILT